MPLRRYTNTPPDPKKSSDSTGSDKPQAELIVDRKEYAFQNEEKAKRAAELTIANEELAFQQTEKEKRADELVIANRELAFQNKEKEKRAAELIIANRELAFQNHEKEERAAELLIANKQLAHENQKKEIRAAELIVANKELSYQNKEKEKRAAELKIANIELVYQNEEKEKRAAELIAANAELAVQNEEKENKALELRVANRKLAFQNKEKEKREAELKIANIELAFQIEEKEKRADELSKANNELASRHEEIIDQAAKLEAANKELESFSYSVSHDLRAPLRAIQGYSRMLKELENKKEDPEVHRLLNNIITNSQKMGQLIDDLLTFSRLGRKELVKVTVPMNNLVTDLCRELKNELPLRNIDFRVDALLVAKADVATIKQVWMNLLSNAVKYTKHRSNAIVEIQSIVNQSETTYSIKDNGAGFDMRYVGKLYGVFQRLHSEEEFEGTGVGLAIVHRIITRHGGRVWAEGKVDEGATFYFTLPNT